MTKKREAPAAISTFAAINPPRETTMTTQTNPRKRRAAKKTRTTTKTTTKTTSKRRRANPGISGERNPLARFVWADAYRTIVGQKLRMTNDPEQRKALRLAQSERMINRATREGFWSSLSAMASDGTKVKMTSDTAMTTSEAEAYKRRLVQNQKINKEVLSWVDSAVNTSSATPGLTDDQINAALMFVSDSSWRGNENQLVAAMRKAARSVESRDNNELAEVEYVFVNRGNKDDFLRYAFPVQAPMYTDIDGNTYADGAARIPPKPPAPEGYRYYGMEKVFKDGRVVSVGASPSSDSDLEARLSRLEAENRKLKKSLATTSTPKSESKSKSKGKGKGKEKNPSFDDSSMFGDDNDGEGGFILVEENPRRRRRGAAKKTTKKTAKRGAKRRAKRTVTRTVKTAKKAAKKAAKKFSKKTAKRTVRRGSKVTGRTGLSGRRRNAECEDDDMLILEANPKRKRKSARGAMAKAKRTAASKGTVLGSMTYAEAADIKGVSTAALLRKVAPTKKGSDKMGPMAASSVNKAYKTKSKTSKKAPAKKRARNAGVLDERELIRSLLA